MTINPKTNNQSSVSQTATSSQQKDVCYTIKNFKQDTK